jgi:Ni,Fe-hydrogenase I small subunit
MVTPLVISAYCSQKGDRGAADRSEAVELKMRGEGIWLWRGVSCCGCITSLVGDSHESGALVERRQ